MHDGVVVASTTSSDSIALPKVFALSFSFLQRLDSQHHHAGAGAAPSDDDDTTSTASLDGNACLLCLDGSSIN
jgi:hypothetical protein